jgi:hypothetical protein
MSTERTGTPHTLVCTKNKASYVERLKLYQQDQEHLATVRSIEASLPKGGNRATRERLVR